MLLRWLLVLKLLTNSLILLVPTWDEYVFDKDYLDSVSKPLINLRTMHSYMKARQIKQINIHTLK